MMKLTKERAAAAVLVMALAVSGCGQMGSTQTKNKAETVKETTAETEAETEPEETLSPEQMDMLKYNYYVELNNDIVKILDGIDYYFEVVEYQEEFALIQDSGHTYGYRVYGVNSDILDDCLQLADMEPAYEHLDPLVKDMADPLRTLMDTFSKVGKGGDYAANQYEKAKEYHAAIYTASQEFESLGHEFIRQVGVIANERIAAEEEKMKDEGRLIAYNASRGISIGQQIMDEIAAQGVTDENITELDLTNIRPLYDELVVVSGELDAACANKEQLIKESMSDTHPFSGLYGRMIQALEWMIKQVESGRPIEDTSLEPLGSIAHFSNTLSDCIDRYNTVFVD